MAINIKDTLERVGRVKNIWIIVGAIILGIILCATEQKAVITTDGVERDIAELCKVVTGKEAYVSVNTDASGTLVGIAVVFEGADAPSEKLKVTEMLSTLYAISTSRVYVSSPG